MLFSGSAKIDKFLVFAAEVGPPEKVHFLLDRGANIVDGCWDLNTLAATDRWCLASAVGTSHGSGVATSATK